MFRNQLQRSGNGREEERHYGSEEVDFLLQQREECRGMGTVHLGVVKLKGHFQGCAPYRAAGKELFFISGPYHERVVEHSAVHSHRTVNIILHKS